MRLRCVNDVSQFAGLTYLAAAAWRLAFLSCPLVAEYGCTFRNSPDQRLGLARIADLPAGQSQTDGASVSIDKSTEFACKTAVATFHATTATSPPFTRRTVLAD
jgi:hypothetical protein